MHKRMAPPPTRHLAPELAPLVERWLLRILVPLGGHREFLLPHGFRDDAIAEVLGLEGAGEQDDDAYDPRRVLVQLRRLHRNSERRAAKVVVPAALRANTQRLAALVGLSEVDCRLLELTVLLHTERLLDDAGDLLGSVSSNRLAAILAVLVDRPEASVRAALSPQGLLTRSGLLRIDYNGSGSLRAKLDLLSPHFADHICRLESDPVDLLRDTLLPSPAAQLCRADYAHIEAFLEVLTPYLRKTLAGRRVGVNVLLHGAPGTGKTELTRLMAQALACPLFEIASADEDGDPVSGERRLRAFRAAQSFLAQQRGLLLFDEVEDVFAEPLAHWYPRSSGPSRKAWINRTLEENPVPTFWVANSIAELDPAFLRRFDLVLELPVPPRRQRERILVEQCADLLPPARLARIADCEGLAPAVVTRAAGVVAEIRDTMSDARAAQAFEMLLSNTLTAQGQPPLARSEALGVAGLYDPAWLHTDADLDAVANGLEAGREGRLCLYGPPGTGKTAWARWLADRLGMPLREQRASDLLSKWLGESEQNLARVFREAEREGALLLIDEVDSFLYERAGGQHSWEVTLVNEMLTQMERYAGVFIASTNRMDGLDEAALRRFDLKVHFDFLRPAQVESLAHRYLASLQLETSRPLHWNRLHAVTPGDFAAIARQHRFRPLTGAQDLFARLEAECALKGGSRRAIGFQS